MTITRTAVAGTLESSDAQITVEPGHGSVEVSIQSSVLNQYGRQIMAAVRDVLARLEVTDARVTVVDMGALDCTLRARTECAVFRGSDFEGRYPWGGAVQ